MPDLERFVAAQAPVWDAALAEVTAGRKRGHWMWFVFPQIAGLGHSATARHSAVADRDEARRYFAHPLLGPRLVEAVRALTAARPGASAEAMLGAVDALKLRSSLTLFAAVADDAAPFAAALARFHAGVPDAETLRRL